MANIPLKSITFPGLPDTYVIPDPDGTLSVAGAAADAKVVGDALAEKANIDGSYEGLTAGNAEQLISSVGINDKVPYNFRTTGGSADVGNRKTEKIIGGTIVWNQLYFKHTGYATESSDTTGLTISVDNDGFLNVTGTAENNCSILLTPYARVVPANHVCLIICDGATGFRWARNGFGTYTTGDSYINKHITNFGASIRISIVAGTEYNIRARFASFDLTQLFGSAIADYLYSLEQGTAGAGAAKFRQLFPKPYYAYNAGELMSVKTSKAISVGFNAYDNSTGKAKLVGGNVYQITGTYTALTFNGETITPDSNGKFTPSEIGELNVTGGNATDTCVHLVWDGERDGEFELFKKNEYPLDSDLELRGVWKLDSNNDIYCDGDICESDGKVTRRYGFYTFDGTEAWGAGSVSGRYQLLFNAIAPQLSTANALQNCVSSKYGRFAYKNENKVAYINTTSSARSIIINDDSITSISEAKAAFNGTTLVYELATPTEETADPYTNPMVDDDWGTEEFVDAGVEAGSRDVAVPVGHDTFYQANLRAKLEMAPDSPDGAGDYMVRQTDGKNSYVPLSSNATIAGLVNRVPEAPSEDGTYTLKATVASGVKTYAWVADE